MKMNGGCSVGCVDAHPTSSGQHEHQQPGDGGHGQHGGRAQVAAGSRRGGRTGRRRSSRGLAHLVDGEPAVAEDLVHLGREGRRLRDDATRSGRWRPPHRRRARPPGRRRARRTPRRGWPPAPPGPRPPGPRGSRRARPCPGSRARGSARRARPRAARRPGRWRARGPAAGPRRGRAGAGRRRTAGREPLEQDAGRPACHARVAVGRRALLVDGLEVEQVGGRLRHQPDQRAARPAASRAAGSWPSDAHRSRRTPAAALQRPDQRRLARAVAAHQRDHLARRPG